VRRRPSPLELIEKLGPLAIALCGGAWVLFQYVEFAKLQASLSEAISKHQLELTER